MSSPDGEDDPVLQDNCSDVPGQYLNRQLTNDVFPSNYASRYLLSPHNTERDGANCRVLLGWWWGEGEISGGYRLGLKGQMTR